MDTKLSVKQIEDAIVRKYWKSSYLFLLRRKTRIESRAETPC